MAEISLEINEDGTQTVYAAMNDGKGLLGLFSTRYKAWDFLRRESYLYEAHDAEHGTVMEDGLGRVSWIEEMEVL